MSGLRLDAASRAGARLEAPTLGTAPLPIGVVPPAPCTGACPAGINVKAYVSLISAGRFAEALDVIRERCPLPAVCGRVCHAPCEDVCARVGEDGAVAIRALKRFADEFGSVLPGPEPRPLRAGAARVAVVGSGPAGLTAAFDLRRGGYPVTIFESREEPGGMLRYGIADYRLPPDVLDAEIATILAEGIDLVVGRRIDADGGVDELLTGDFGAVVLAVGAQRGRRLGIAGEDESPEIEDALGFLRRVNAGDRSPIDGTVLVIGGGSTAVEAARSARRLGAASVEVLYRRTIEEMPASREEVEIARSEGVAFRFLVAPAAAVRDGDGFVGLECSRMELGEPDSSGRRRPVAMPGTEFTAPADRVLAAVGQEVVVGDDGDGAGLLEGGRLLVDEATTMTKRWGVFAAGDAATGPATVIEAIAAGHRVAEAVAGYLETGHPATPGLGVAARPVEFGLPDAPVGAEGALRPEVRPIEAGREFAEVEQVFAAVDAVVEANRCLRCGPCGECRVCVSTCDRRHLVLEASDGESIVVRAPSRMALALDGAASGTVSLRSEDGSVAARIPVDLVPARVMLHPQRCRGCALCVDVCGFGALEMIGAGDDQKVAVLDETRCRGCSLCLAVCPTDALAPAAAAGLPDTGDAEVVVVGCERRLGSAPPELEADGVEVATVRVRCLGALDAGSFLSLLNPEAGRVIVLGCTGDRCRFEGGSDLAAGQIDQARLLLRLVGSDPGRIVLDRSAAADPAAVAGVVRRAVAGDPLAEPVVVGGGR